MIIAAEDAEVVTKTLKGLKIAHTSSMSLGDEDVG